MLPSLRRKKIKKVKMNKIFKRNLWGLFLVIILCPSIASAGLDKQLYLKAKQFAKGGQYDFSFMQYRAIVQEYPISKYKDEAMFAVCEYYYSNGMLKEARDSFRNYIKETKDFSSKLAAYFYLLKIAKKFGDKNWQEELEKKIVDLRTHNFIFEDSKQYNFRSALGRTYKVVYTISRIELFIDDTSFEKLIF